MNRCPVCNARFSAETTCRRCQADLTWMMRNAARAARLRQQAIETLADGDIAGSKKILATAQATMKSSSFAPLAKTIEIVRMISESTS